MYNKEELCEKIHQMYPEIGRCGININIEFDDGANAWVIDLKKDEHELKTFLEPADADACMSGKQCVSLGFQIAQLKKNVEQLH